MYVKNIIFHNRAPFESLNISFDQNDIAVLTAINGKGKTTVLSYVNMILRVSSVINEGAIEYENSDKAMLRKDGYVAVVRKNYRINGKKLETKNWILTAYHKEII